MRPSKTKFKIDDDEEVIKIDVKPAE